LDDLTARLNERSTTSTATLRQLALQFDSFKQLLIILSAIEHKLQLSA